MFSEIVKYFPSLLMVIGHHKFLGIFHNQGFAAKNSKCPVRVLNIAPGV
jgi:hypothetical protein